MRDWNLWSKVFLKHLPDKKKSSREDHIRVREASSPLSNISNQYPIWIAAFANSILCLEAVEVARILDLYVVHFHAESLLEASIVFFVTMLCTALAGMIIQSHVHAELAKIIERTDLKRVHTGFELYNSYDKSRSGKSLVPRSYIQQQWPRMFKTNASALQMEHGDYWRMQKSAWNGLFVRSYFAGMIFSIGMCFFLIFYPVIWGTIVVILILLLIKFMPKEKRPYGYRGY